MTVGGTVANLAQAEINPMPFNVLENTVFVFFFLSFSKLVC
jgi:hypothetical protein